jgi:hypothetical protein
MTSQEVVSETAGPLNLNLARLAVALMPFVRCLIEQGFLLPASGDQASA